MFGKNLAAECAKLRDFWSPKVIGEVNGQLLKVAKLKGQFVWHAHDDEDELFYVVRGRMRIETEGEAVSLSEGEFATIPKGMRHNPVADAECWILLIEPASTKHTGDVVTPLTRTLDMQYDPEA